MTGWATMINPRLMARKLRHLLTERHGLLGGRRSYSQCGEDTFVDWLLRGQQTGRFVDVGAFHPVKLSNTHLFYRRGWRGINIDARREVVDLFARLRPHDINVECCVGDPNSEPVTFCEFPVPDLSTADPVRVAEVERQYGFQVTKRHIVRKRGLAQILEEHMSPGVVDLITIDVEGLDAEVLKSNDWNRFPARVVIFERNDSEPVATVNDVTVMYMRDLGYRLRGILGVSVVLAQD